MTSPNCPDVPLILPGLSIDATASASRTGPSKLTAFSASQARWLHDTVLIPALLTRQSSRWFWLAHSWLTAAMMLLALATSSCSGCTSAAPPTSALSDSAAASAAVQPFHMSDMFVLCTGLWLAGTRTLRILAAE